MPSVPPYSSTTMARWWPSRRISDIADSTRLVPGIIFTSRAISPTRTVAPLTSGANRSRTCTNPTTSSCEPRTTG